MDRSRIRVFDKNGTWIEEFDASTIRSWILNDYGECAFTLSILNPKVRQAVLEFGLIVLVTNKDSKPWVGVIDTPRTWLKNGVKIMGYQAEFLLSFRNNQGVDAQSNTLLVDTTLAGKAGALFSQIIGLANLQEDLLIRAGEIYADGADRQETLSADFLTHVRNIAERSGNDFEIVPEIQEGGNLLLKANWYKSKGATLPLILQEGLNIELTDETLVEQGTIVNSSIGLSEGGEDARLAALVEDQDSIDRYRLRQKLNSYIGVTQLPTLIENTTYYLEQNSDARAILKVTCIDPDVFRHLSAGDTVRLILNSAGFRTDGSIGTDKYVRIVALQAIDDRGVMEILLETFSTGS